MDPLELALERALPGRLLLLLEREARLLLLEPRRVVALPGNAGAAVELEDPTCDVVEEVAVVGDGDDRARVVVQEALEPGDRLRVEMVGRLVEQQQIGTSEEQPAERHSPALSTRQPGDVGVSGGETQRVHGDLERAIEVPRPGGVDAVLQLGLLGEELVEVGVGGAHRLADLLVTVEQRPDLGHPFGDVAEYVLGGVERRFLGEEAHAEAGRETGLAGEAVVLSGHDAQE